MPQDEESVFKGGPDKEKSFIFEVQRQVIGRTIQSITFCPCDEEMIEGRTGSSFTLHFDDGGAMGLFIEGAAEVTLILPRKTMSTSDSVMVN